jgi:hypothetical protein
MRSASARLTDPADARAALAARTGIVVEHLGTASADDAWLPGFGLPGLHEYPSVAIEYHGELVVSGWLRSAGGRKVNGIARWTANGWEPLGDGVVPAFALAILGDRLYAGEYTGGVAAWDGHTWTRLPDAPINLLNALFVLDGTLYAAGSEGQQGRIVRFDGGAWQPVGGGFDDVVIALGSYQGSLIAGGRFKNYQGQPCGYLARWDGTAWVSLGSGIDPADYAAVSAIEEYNGRLIVGGWFASCGSVSTPGLAAWDGTSWSSLPGAPTANVTDLMTIDGSLYVAGAFAGDYSSVARWDGATWTPEGLEQWTQGLASVGGRVTAVGGFYGAGCPNGRILTGVAMLGPDGWDGLEHWNGSMHGLADNAGAADLNSAVVYRGDLVVAGIFGIAGDGSGWKRILSPARWDGTTWQPIGDGVWCARIVEVVGDELIAAGGLSGPTPEGPLDGVGRWDGASWHRMGSGLSGLPCAIAGFDRRIYVGGELQILATGERTTLAVFDGTEWASVPGAPSTAQWNTPRVSALEVSGGRLYAGGNFEGAGTVQSPGVVAWDGRSWTAVGTGLGGEVLDLEIYQGDLYAAGTVGLTGGDWEGLVRWDGSSWNSMGLGYSQVLALGHYGDKLVVAGNSVDRVAPGSLGVTSWDGQQWRGFGTGVDGQVKAIRQLGGDLIVAGCFSRAGEQSSFAVARWAGGESSPPGTPGPGPAPGGGVAAVRSALVTSDQAAISYSMPVAGRACLELFNVRGARVATLCDGNVGAGANVITWSPGSPAPFPANGVYFLRLTTAGRTAHAKVIFAR